MAPRLVSKAFFHHHLNNIVDSIGKGLSGSKRGRLRKKIGKRMLALTKPKKASKGKYDMEKDIRNASHNIKRMAQFKKGGKPSRDVSKKGVKGVSYNHKATAGPAQESMKEFMASYDKMRPKNLPTQAIQSTTLSGLSKRDPLVRWEDGDVHPEVEKKTDTFRHLENVASSMQPSVDIRKHKHEHDGANKQVEHISQTMEPMKNEIEEQKKKTDEAAHHLKKVNSKYSAWATVGQGLLDKHHRLVKKLDKHEEGSPGFLRAHKRINKNLKHSKEHQDIGNEYMGHHGNLQSNYDNHNKTLGGLINNHSQYGAAKDHHSGIANNALKAIKMIKQHHLKAQLNSHKAREVLGKSNNNTLDTLHESEEPHNSDLIDLEKIIGHIPDDRLKGVSSNLHYQPLFKGDSDGHNSLHFTTVPKNNGSQYKSLWSDIIGKNVGGVAEGERIKTHIRPLHPHARVALLDHAVHGKQPTADVIRKALHSAYSTWKG